MRFDDLTGRRFGRLTVLSRAEDHVCPSGQHKVLWNCKCDCGNEIIVWSGNLKNSHTQSCGCLQKEKTSEVRSKTNCYDWDSAEYLIGYTSSGKKFILDKSDYNLVKDYCWYISNQGYVVTSATDNTGKRIRMHRLLFNNCDGMEIDHINHDTTDNRRSNLRIVNRSQNNTNKGLRKHNTSGCTGVSWHSKREQWYSRINVNKKTIFLGWFNDYDEAVKARKEAEEKYFGEYSYDNSINKNKEESA